MPQLIVGLSPELAAAFEDGSASADAVRLRELVRQAQVDLRPQHARSLDRPDEGTVWYWAEAPASPAAGDPPAPLDAELLRLPGVTAAYVKPEDAAP